MAHSYMLIFMLMLISPCRPDVMISVYGLSSLEFDLYTVGGDYLAKTKTTKQCNVPVFCISGRNIAEVEARLQGVLVPVHDNRKFSWCWNNLSGLL